MKHSGGKFGLGRSYAIGEATAALLAMGAVAVGILLGALGAAMA